MPDSSTDMAAEVADIQDVAAAESSTATEGVKSYEEIVEALFDADKEESPASASGEEDDSSDPDANPDEEATSEEAAAKVDDPSDDELKKYSENAQRRIRDLVDRRKQVEAVVAEKDQELQNLRPQAEQMGKLVDYMRTNEIEPKHLDNVLQITSLINKGQYDQALQVIGPIYNELQTRAGNVLPADLQEDIRLGYITKARAHELQRERVANVNTRQRSELEANRAAQQRQQSETQNLQHMLASTGDTWAAEKKASDPDWSLKQELVTEQVELRLRRLAAENAVPRTKEAVRQVLDETLKDVEKRLRQFRPAPKPISNQTGRPASSVSRAKPATYMDAVEQALEGNG